MWTKPSVRPAAQGAGDQEGGAEAARPLGPGRPLEGRGCRPRPDRECRRGRAGGFLFKRSHRLLLLGTDPGEPTVGRRSPPTGFIVRAEKGGVPRGRDGPLTGASAPPRVGDDALAVVNKPLKGIVWGVDWRTFFNIHSECFFLGNIITFALKRLPLLGYKSVQSLL